MMTATAKVPIKLLSSRAGHGFTQRPGETIYVSREEAKRMVDDRLAEWIEDKQRIDGRETAMQSRNRPEHRRR